MFIIIIIVIINGGGIFFPYFDQVRKKLMLFHYHIMIYQSKNQSENKKPRIFHYHVIDNINGDLLNITSNLLSHRYLSSRSYFTCMALRTLSSTTVRPPRPKGDGSKTSSKTLLISGLSGTFFSSFATYP